MKIAERNFPAGWMRLTLEDVAEIHDNLREPVNSAERAKRPGSYPYYGATGQVGWIDDYRQDGEYVLLGEDGAPFFEPTKEKAYLVSGKCWVNNHAHVLKGREDLCSNRYLLYALNQTNYRGYANGTTRLKLTQSAMRQLPINLAPLPEQHRIVAKIEELFSELDKGIENLKTARAQLKVYRQALLKHAFEGKLTAQWRAENQDKLETADALLKRIQQERAQRYQQQIKSPSLPLLQRGKTTSAASVSVSPFEKGGLGGIPEHPPLKKGGRGDLKPKAPKPLPPLTAEELAELPELPEGWGWCKLGNFIDSIDAGKSFKCDEREPRANEIGVAKVSAVTWGEYDESESKTCTDSSKENEAYLIQSGDFILSRANTIDLVGACVIARKVTKKIMLSDKTLRIRFDGFSQEYFLQYLGSRIGRKQIMLLSTGNQESMRNIGQERIRSITVPICSVVEADAVIESLAARLSEVDQLDLTINTSLQQAEALRQSILKKAFAGLLVPQDPHDEPASTLLTRIKAGRETVAAKPRKISTGDKLSPAEIAPFPFMNRES
ncbi:MAG: hypothetical protein HKM01_07905 [Gallionella sp.]|nr:hypothetical protein [Gallionella sp.]